MEKWEAITDEMTGEYIRSEYRREIIETGGTMDSREGVIEHLTSDARHNFTEKEASDFYDGALMARKALLERIVAEGEGHEMIEREIHKLEEYFTSQITF